MWMEEVLVQLHPILQSKNNQPIISGYADIKKKKREEKNIATVISQKKNKQGRALFRRLIRCTWQRWGKARLGGLKAQKLKAMWQTGKPLMSHVSGARDGGHLSVFKETNDITGVELNFCY